MSNSSSKFYLPDISSPNIVRTVLDAVYDENWHALSRTEEYCNKLMPTKPHRATFVLRLYTVFSRSVTDTIEIDKAVHNFVNVNAQRIFRSEKEKAFDDILRLLGWCRPPTRSLQLEDKMASVDIGDFEAQQRQPQLVSESLPSRLLDLPPELHVQIVSHLDWHSTTSLRLASRYWSRIVSPHTVDSRTSLLTHKMRCQRLNHLLELRLDELFAEPDTPWFSHEFLRNVTFDWHWAFRYPCYTCMRWLRGYDFFDKHSYNSDDYLKRHLLRSNRWPLRIPYPPRDVFFTPTPDLALSCGRDVASSCDTKMPRCPYSRMCIHCAARKDFVARGCKVGGVYDDRSPWFVCICRKVFWRYPDSWHIVTGSDKRRQGFEPLKNRQVDLTAQSPWRSFWCCDECNEAGLSKENWLLWAHELRIGDTEAHIERIAGRSIANGKVSGRMTKEWCPIMKEERYCRCAKWFVQEVWDGLQWLGNKTVRIEWGNEWEVEQDMRWVKYECSKALCGKRVRWRSTAGAQ